MHAFRFIEGQIDVTLKMVIFTLFLACFSGTQGPLNVDSLHFFLNSAKNYKVPSPSFKYTV